MRNTEIITNGSQDFHSRYNAPRKQQEYTSIHVSPSEVQSQTSRPSEVQVYSPTESLTKTRQPKEVKDFVNQHQSLTVNGEILYL